MEINIQIVIAIIAVLIILFLLFLGLSGGKSKQKWKEQVANKLSFLSKQAQNKSELNQRNLLIEADKLLDHVFKEKRISGDTMGERLKSTKKLYDKKLYNQIWEAHKARNKLVHEIDFKPDIKLLERHFYYLSKAIKQLLEK